MALPHLILTFTEGVSLETWATTGMLTREWALYRALLPHYASLTLISYGHNPDHAILRTLLTPAEAAKVHLITNDKRATLPRYAAHASACALDQTPASADTIIKTNQMPGGEMALALLAAFRAQGRRAVLIARGGYPWALFTEYEKGQGSPQALAAIERERALCTGADMVVGTTAAMIDDLTCRHNLDPSRTRIIPNYVEITREPAGIQSRDAATLLYAGQLVARKRVDILIEALALLPADLRASARLDIIGEGPERPRLEALIKGLGVRAAITPRIPHADLMARMHRCTLYLQASELEGHPKTVIEAMTSGCPVIVAEAPGLEAVDHEVTGLKVRPNPRAFAAAIETLLRQPARRSRLGIAAAQAARRSYTLPAILAIELALHDEALQTRERLIGVSIDS